jgi:uncharacterized protein (DUF2252 family)
MESRTLAGVKGLDRSIAGAPPHLTVEQRAKQGKAARKICPRSVHAVWKPAADRADPIALLEAQAAGRVPELVPIRYQRMLVSPFAFYRGAAVIMASDLSTMSNTGLIVQLCGDAHLSNFGGFASPERDLILDVNDFDETLPGPWEWDVKRLLASVEIAGREVGIGPNDLRKIVLATAGEYHRSMKEFAAKGNLEMWYLHLDLAGLKKRLGKKAKLKAVKAIEADLAHASHKDNHRALEKLTRQVNGQARIAPNPPLIVPMEDLAADMEREVIVRTLREFFRNYRMSLRGDHRHLFDDYRFTHLARKVVGVGSVGMRAWIVLMLGRDDTDPLFLQVKEAQASVLEPYLGKSVYGNGGRRVVEGQWLMQSSSDIFLGWDRIEGADGIQRDYYVRQLWDWKVSADIETMDPDELTAYGRMCAWTLARAHARSGDEVAISAYLGKNDHVDRALAEFAVAYADQNKRDYQALVVAVKSGRVKAEARLSP